MFRRFLIRCAACTAGLARLSTADQDPRPPTRPYTRPIATACLWSDALQTRGGSRAA